MEKKLIIAIDVDGVLRDNLGIMVDLYNKNFDDNKSVDDITEFKTELSFPKIAEQTGITSSKWFFQDHAKEIFSEAPGFPEIKNDIDELRKLGEVIIVTYQKTTMNKIQTLEWLEKNGIEYDGICFLRDKSKLKAKENERLIFVDDNDWNFCGNQANIGILINAPYNKNTDLKKLKKMSFCDDIQRFNSLHEFVVKLKENKI